MSNLPTEGRSQEIGRLAGRALAAKLPKAWIEKELDGDSDFGIDYLMQIKSNTSSVSFSFYLQLKGTTSPKYSADAKFISYPFKVKTLQYYRRQEPAVMVAIVDIKGNEDELWNCPIYYFWLEDSWFYDNQDRLTKQDTILVTIPVNNILMPSLDIYDYYEQRINEKFKVAELKKEIGPHSQNVAQSIQNLSNAIAQKPIILKASENLGDEPWIENPKGEVPTLLKSCSEKLNTNQLSDAKEILDELDHKLDDLSSHNLAEYYYQKATFLTLQTNYEEANEIFEVAAKYSEKLRYKLAAIESRFKLNSMPSSEDLTDIANSLTDTEYRSAITKCKCMALTGAADEALVILKTKHPKHKVGQLLILTLGRKDDELDTLLSEVDESDFESNRDKYTYHSFAARRAYIKATLGDFVYGEVLHVRGKANFDIQALKKALAHIEQAWDFARKVGYPGDIMVLLDISTLIYGYFNKLDTLFYHFDEILGQRPNNIELLRHYTRLLFNEGAYKKTIELFESGDFELNGDDYGLLFLSNYHLGKSLIALNILKDNEQKILEDLPQNVALLFCIGAEIAEKLLDDDLAVKYKSLIKGFDNGEAVLAISVFIRNVNNDLANKSVYGEELFSEYIRLGSPIEIAEQLLSFLNPKCAVEAKRICVLAGRILTMHELFEKDYIRLAQAHITNDDHSKALSIAEKNIEKGVFDPYWSIIQTVCLHKLGRIGLAHDIIKEAVQNNQFSNEHNHHYVNICLQLGLVDDVESALFDLLEASTENEQKLLILNNLISILLSKPNSVKKATSAIRKFGALADQNDMTQEGQFLFLFLMSSKTEDDEEIKAFQIRLKNYTQRFPDSPILKQGHVDLDGGADSLISSLHKMAGITDEQINKWEQNKISIRNGSLPVPFVMLDKFLSDSHDIFASWMLSLSDSEKHLEFKIKHAPQLDMKIFQNEISTHKTVLIEDTTLLILHELKLLEPLLEYVTDYCLLETTFERIAKNSHPLAGTIYTGLAAAVLESLNKFKSKMVLFPLADDDPIEAFIKASNKYDALCLVDDLNYLQLVNVGNKANIKSANIFNVIEFMHENRHLNDDEKFSSISKASGLGFQIPNMTLGLLAETLAFHAKIVNEVDYLDGEFKIIFDKVFNAQRDTVEAIELFLKMVGYAVHHFDMSLQPQPIVSLLRSILLRHCYKSLESFAAFFFIYLSLVTPVKIESELLSVSPAHSNLWRLYRDISLLITDGNSTLEESVTNVATELFMLQEDSRTAAYTNIKRAFVPMTQESETLERIYQEVSIQKRLFSLRNEK